MRRLTAHRPVPGTRCQGFSLVDLLVVTGVLCILIDIVLAAIPLGRDTSRHARAKHMLSQINVATVLYSNDFGPSPPNSGPGARVAPESLFYYLCTPDASARHPYLEIRYDCPTCDYTFVGTGRLLEVDERTSPPPSNGFPELADPWGRPIYYDASIAPHTPGRVDLWSGGPNLVNDNGAAGTDDVTEW